MTKAEAIHGFFAGFGIPAYEEHHVPVYLDAAQTVENRPPYITYQYAESDFYGESVALTADIWAPLHERVYVTQKAAEIGAAIRPFRRLVCDDGYIIVTKGSPFSQCIADGHFEREYLNFTITFITN